MRLRALFVLSDLEAGGAQRVILTVIRYLDRKVFEPHLAVVRMGGPLTKEIPENVRVHDLEVRRVRYAVGGILRLYRTLKPDVIVSTLGHLNLLILAIRVFARRSSSLFVREANTPSVRLRFTAHPWLYPLLYRILYPLADKVICNSEYVKRDLAEHFAYRAEKVAVIPNPVDMEGIRRKVTGGRNPYQGDASELVAVGRLNHQKGFDLLLMAFRDVLKRTSRVHLTIVGDGPKGEYLRSLSKSLGISDSVTFAGQQDNPYPYMAHADLLILSSRWEGSPNTVIEALACGTPVLAFDSPGGTGEIIEDGRNGWLVSPEDWEALGKRIVMVVEGRKWEGLDRGTLLPQGHRLEAVMRLWEEVLAGGRRCEDVGA